MSEPIGEAVLVLRTDAKEFDASLESREKKAEAFQQRLDRVSASASNTVKPLSDAASNVNTFGRSTEDAGKKADSAGSKVDPFGKKVSQITSVSHQASIALSTLNSRLQSMAFAALFTAIGAAIPKIMQWLGATRDLSQEIGNTNSSLFSLARAVNPLVNESESLARAQFELAKIKLFLAQATARETREEIRANIARLESMSTLERLKILTSSFFTTFGTYEDALKEIAKAEKDNKEKAKELRAELVLMDELLKVHIPSWDAFKIMLQGVKEEMVFDVRQPFDVMEAELEDFMAGMDEKVQTGSLFTTDPAKLEAQTERLRAHNAEIAQIHFDTDQMILESRAATFSSMASLADIFFTLSGQKSKKLFKLWQVAAASEATANALAAGVAALRHPPGPPSTIPMAAAVTLKGLATAARIATMPFGGGGGGGGGISIGSAGGGTPTVGLRDTRVVSRPPVTLNLTIQGNVVGQETWIHEELIPAIEDASINERSKLAMKES